MIGKTITLNGSVYTVVGIMPAGFEYDGVQDVFVPMASTRPVETKGNNWTVIGRLKQASQQIRRVLK